MAAPAKTKAPHIRGFWDAKLIHELVTQHNLGVQNDHAVAALADADATLTDMDFEAGLTALEIPTLQHTNVETAVAGFPHDARFLSEALVRDLVEQHNARITDLLAFHTKLAADDAGDGDYGTAPALKKISALGIDGGAGSLFLDAVGSGPSGRLLQALADGQAAINAAWHAITAEADGSSGVGTTTYEAAATARDITF